MTFTGEAAIPLVRRMLSVGSVAERLGCSERQARQLAEEGAFPGAARSGLKPRSPWAVPPEDVDAFLAASNARERARWAARRADSAVRAVAAGKHEPPAKKNAVAGRR